MLLLGPKCPSSPDTHPGMYAVPMHSAIVRSLATADHDHTTAVSYLNQVIKHSLRPKCCHIHHPILGGPSSLCLGEPRICHLAAAAQRQRRRCIRWCYDDVTVLEHLAAVVPQGMCA